ncbi:MAG: MATE family efflux transporter [Candidatus Solibacter usitatus]|nr:MATE family efflux transporter [Candidatus Solibacter usitatus]
MSRPLPVDAVVSPSFWQSLREAILGSRQDFTEGSLNRAIVLLAIPMVLEMVMESLFGVVDAYFVGRLGTDAVGAVGVTEALLTLIFPLCMGLSMATTATVARRIGEKNHEGAADAAVQAIAAGLVISVLFGAVGLAFAPGFLKLMGAPPGVRETGSRFAAILLGGSGTIVMLFLMNAVFRGAGDAAIAMRVLWLANLINIALVPCLINGWGPFPRMGLEGAAVGTTIGRGVGVLYQLWTLASGKSRIPIARRHLHLHLDVMLRMVRMSASGTIQFAIAHWSWLALTRILTTFGSAALAGYTIAIRIIVFAILPSWGLSNAAATLVGQNLGARKPDRAENAVWRTSLYNAAFLGTVALVFILFANPLVRIFTRDEAAIEVGVHCLRFISYGYPFYAFGMVMVQAFNGAGDTVTPTKVNVFCYWLWEIPLALTLSKLAAMGPNGVFLAITVAESTMAVVASLMFRRGRWKQARA